MTEDLLGAFRILALLTFVLVPLRAYRRRGRTYATFGAVMLGFALPGAWVSITRLAGWLPEPWAAAAAAAFVWGIAATALHLLFLVRARLRTRLFRVVISVPGQAFVAASLMSGPWQLLLWPARAALESSGFDALSLASRWLDLVPYAVGVLSVATSTRRVPEWVRITLSDEGPEDLTRVPVERWRRRPPRSRAGRCASCRSPIRISDPGIRSDACGGRWNAWSDSSPISCS